MGRDRGLSVETTSVSPCKEGGGLAFLMDVGTTAPPRWSSRRGRRLLRKAAGVPNTHPPDKKGDLGHLEEPLRRLSFTDKDLLEVIDDRADFRLLQSELRKKGAVTNSMVKEGIHFYVQSCLENKRLSDSPTTMITPITSTATVHRHRTFSWS
jgi:hypothetical protein